MVSDYSDAGQQQYLAGKGIDLIRGTGRLAGPGVVEVEGVPHTARHVVVATGSDPVIPPVPGLRELDGVWTNREVTGMKAVPRRLLILGGGPVGAEMAQAVRRLGCEVALVEGAGHVLAREPDPLGHALGEVLRADGRRAIPGHARGRSAARRRRLRPDPRRRPRAARRPPAASHRHTPADARRAGHGRRRRLGLGIDAAANQRSQQADRVARWEYVEVQTSRSVAGDEASERVPAGDYGRASGCAGQQRPYLVLCRRGWFIAAIDRI
jgi:NADPH-dependent 2,4-dienoyl-CoA reductase/sulfur reductase-like enzyme